MLERTETCVVWAETKPVPSHSSILIVFGRQVHYVQFLNRWRLKVHYRVNKKCAKQAPLKIYQLRHFRDTQRHVGTRIIPKKTIEKCVQYRRMAMKIIQSKQFTKGARNNRIIYRERLVKQKKSHMNTK